MRNKGRITNMIRSHILVCGGTGCTSNKSHDIIDALNSELRAQGLENEVKVVMTGCFGLCANGPIMVVYPEGRLLQPRYRRRRQRNHFRTHNKGQNSYKTAARRGRHSRKSYVPFPRRNSCRNRSESRCSNCGVIDPEKTLTNT